MGAPVVAEAGPMVEGEAAVGSAVVVTVAATVEAMRAAGAALAGSAAECGLDLCAAPPTSPAGREARAVRQYRGSGRTTVSPAYTCGSVSAIL